MTNNKGSATIILLVILLALLATGGYFGYTRFYLKGDDTNTFTKDLTHIPLQEEVLLSTYEKLPDVYFGLVDINKELQIINKEIERLTEMEKEYPQQIEIISSEKDIWNSVKQDISKTTTTLQKEIETLHVAYRVNQEKGQKRIADKKDQLQESIRKTLEFSQTRTERLKK
ncbi:MAG: hypothetical protein H8E41_13995 [Desulfobulbaceae bacterium]|uniref:Uncharacterized protein n=1 Tax=Candidatus Desulfobia pelagia TaxID=2841692 RepID=A0A8J6NGC5_9BACT|nr:hypothetical protein [Candidatus Desulfobia pelagia]